MILLIKVSENSFVSDSSLFQAVSQVAKMQDYNQNAESYEVVLRPNRSTSGKEVLIFLAVIGVVSMIIAIAFAYAGYWLILPFTGLELLALTIAFYLTAREGKRCEVISINGFSVKVAKGWSGLVECWKNGPEIEYEFPTIWARLEIVKPKSRLYPDKLFICHSGTRVEIGHFLPEDERKELALHLKNRLIAVS